MVVKCNPAAWQIHQSLIIYQFPEIVSTNKINVSLKNKSGYFSIFLVIEEAICSHGRSYIYLTESLISAAIYNCTFWGRPWNLTYNHLLEIIDKPCNKNNCTEMGIKAEMYTQRGKFFVLTTSSYPFCGKYDMHNMLMCIL
jgi:hypothetical protein